MEIKSSCFTADEKCSFRVSVKYVCEFAAVKQLGYSLTLKSIILIVAFLL